jgi:hypothetical protein
MNPCDYFLWGRLKNFMYHNNPHNVQELQAKIEAATESTTGDMLHDTDDSFVVHLQQVHNVKGPHKEHVFT